MFRYATIFLMTTFLLGCASVTEHQHDLASESLRVNPEVHPEMREAIESGKVIPGMTSEQVYIASGEKARGFKTYSIWVVREDSTLSLPPTVIMPGTLTALIIRNDTQFGSGTTEPFTVFLDENKRVLRVERGTANVK